MGAAMSQKTGPAGICAQPHTQKHWQNQTSLVLNIALVSLSFNLLTWGMNEHWQIQRQLRLWRDMTLLRLQPLTTLQAEQIQLTWHSPKPVFATSALASGLVVSMVLMASIFSDLFSVCSSCLARL